MRPAVLPVLLGFGLLGSAALAWHFHARAHELAVNNEALRLQVQEALSKPRETVVREEFVPVPADTGSVVQATSAPDTDALQRAHEEVQKLQLALQERDRTIQQMRQPLTNGPPRDARPWRDPGAWLEDLKKQDPARYDEIVKQREAARQKVQNSFAEKAAHFLNRDTSGLPEDEQKQYQQMLTLLDQTWRLSEQLRTDLPREQRWDIVHTMRDNMTTLEPMLAGERDKEFYDLGRQVGYSESDATQFVQYVNQVINLTSMQEIYRSMRGGGGGMGGGWPGQSNMNSRAR